MRAAPAVVLAALALLGIMPINVDGSRLRVLSFIELSARACEKLPRGGTHTVDGHSAPCGATALFPPEGCKCLPFPPSALQLTAAVVGSPPLVAKYAQASAYATVTAQNSTCTVKASMWNGTTEGADAPTVVETTLVLKDGRDYSLLLVGYFDRSSYRPTSGERGLPGNFGELYAVLLEDNAPPPRGQLGTMRLVHVSPATNVLTAQILDHGSKLTDFSTSGDGVDYVCQRPKDCDDPLAHNARDCVMVTPAYPHAPPPPPGVCDPMHLDEHHNPESCPGFDPKSHPPRAYNCKDPRILNACKEKGPDISPGGGCQQCQCQFREIVDQTTGALSDKISLCSMNNSLSSCPGRPVLHHGSKDDPCPGDHGEKTTARCWREEDPAEPDGHYEGGQYCEDCVNDPRSWASKCHLCNCIEGVAPPPPAACGPWANPTTHHRTPRQEKAYLITQKKWDGRTQSPTFGIGADEVPWVDVPAGVHTIGFRDGNLPYPTQGRRLEMDVNVPVGTDVTVFMHGLPPSNEYPTGHPTAPLALSIATGATVARFVEVKIANTVEGSHIAVGANQTVGGAKSSLKLKLGATGRQLPEVSVAAGTFESLHLAVPNYAHSSRGEWGAYAQYDLGWRAAVGKNGSAPFDLLTGSYDSALLVLSGSPSAPKLTPYAATLPAVTSLVGKAAVRVIHAAYGAHSDSLTVTGVRCSVEKLGACAATPANEAAAVTIATSLTYDHGSTFFSIAAGKYRLDASSSAADHPLSAVLTEVVLYEGLVYTLVVGSRAGALMLLLSLDRSYNSPMIVNARVAFLGGDAEQNIAPEDRVSPPTSISWSMGGTSGLAMTPVTVQPGHVSPYSKVTLTGMYDDRAKQFTSQLRLSVMWVDRLSASQATIECFTELRNMDMEKENNTDWTFIVWGSEKGRTCQVRVNQKCQDLLVSPEPAKGGLRVLAGGAHQPEFLGVAVDRADATTLLVQPTTKSQSGAYTTVSPDVTHISLADSDEQAPLAATVVAGSFQTLLVSYPSAHAGDPPASPTWGVLATDKTLGVYYQSNVRFMNALPAGPGQPTAYLTLKYGREDLRLPPMAGFPLGAAPGHRTAPAPANFFTGFGFFQAWQTGDVTATQIVLPHALQPVQIKPNSCPPHCPLAEGFPAVTPQPTKPQTIILGNNTETAKLFLAGVEDDATAPKLCNARVRMVSLMSAPATLTAAATLGQLPPVTLTSPALSPTAAARTGTAAAAELPSGAYTVEITGGSEKTKCRAALAGGKSYSLYVSSTAEDERALPIYTCRLEVDENYGSIGYVRLAHAAGKNSTYSMTVAYAEDATGECKAAQSALGEVGHGGQTAYMPLPVFGTSQYTVNVQSETAPLSTALTLAAGKHWTVYVMPAGLWAVEDGTAGSWSGGADQVGLRWLDGMPEAADALPWSWKHCDSEDDGCVDGVGSLAMFASAGAAAKYETAEIHGHLLLPAQRWRMGLQVSRVGEKAPSAAGDGEFGTGFTTLKSVSDGTTEVPLQSGALYTVVLSSDRELLMFLDRDGEAKGWWSLYGLMFAVLLGSGLLVLAGMAWCASQWWKCTLCTNNFKASVAVCCARTFGRGGGEGELQEPLVGGEDEEDRGTVGSLQAGEY